MNPLLIESPRAADQGYRGKSRINNTRIVTPKPARKRFRRRAGIEPVIGHWSFKE